MKMSEINVKFTELVNSYIMKGYVINPKTMSGSQGEIGKVDLVKGNDLIRIWMDRTSRILNFNNNDDCWYGSILFIRVGIWNNPANYCGAVWMNELEVLEEYNYYEVRQDAWYIDDLDEALEIQRKRTSRYITREHTDSIILEDPRSKDIARRYLKNHVGYKRVSFDTLYVTKRFFKDGKSRFSIHYRGTVYRLH